MEMSTGVLFGGVVLNGAVGGVGLVRVVGGVGALIIVITPEREHETCGWF